MNCENCKKPIGIFKGLLSVDPKRPYYCSLECRIGVIQEQLNGIASDIRELVECVTTVHEKPIEDLPKAVRAKPTTPCVYLDKTCPICKKEFKTRAKKNQKHCSRQCVYDSQKNPNKKRWRKTIVKPEPVIIAKPVVIAPAAPIVRSRVSVRKAKDDAQLRRRLKELTKL